MDSVPQQTTIIDGYVSHGRYYDAYRYIATQVRGAAGRNQNLPDWFDAAADINGPNQTFLKEWVFTSNSNSYPGARQH
jgi:hypothetical protein